jgi:hypothetical protein
VLEMGVPITLEDLNAQVTFIHSIARSLIWYSLALRRSSRIVIRHAIARFRLIGLCQFEA